MGDSAVVGAGLLGLAVAERLRARGDNVTVFEAASNLGGPASTWNLGGVAWDQRYHITMASDVRTRQLLRSIDLEHELRWVRTRSGFYAGPEFGVRPFSNAVDFLRLPTLDVMDKARLAATVLSGARQGGWERMERLQAREWLTKWSGRRVFERFWQPLLRAKLGDDWPYASAAFVAATMQRHYTGRGGALRPERYGYVPGGFARIFDRYSAALLDDGVKVSTGVRVRRVRQTTAGLELQFDDGSETFDRVVVTTAAPLAADLCPGLSRQEQERLRAVRYVGVVCASLLLPYQLSPYLTTYVADPASPFATMVAMTPLIRSADVGGWNVVYLSSYAPADSTLFDADDDAIRHRYLGYLRAMHPQLDPAAVGAFRVSRVRHVFAVPTVGYSRTMPSTTTSIPGLQLIGSANLPFATLNVNDTLSLVQELR